jgi:periplasmic divalent cation tolerance protein
MTNARIVLTTVALHERGLHIARTLVTEHLAACVNITPAVESIYFWEGKVEQALEYVLIMKTTAEKIDALRERLLQLHAYDTPEFLVLPVESGSEAYLNWIRQSVSA